MPEVVLFNKPQAARITKTVLRDERSAPNGGNRRSGTSSPDPSIWIELTSEGTGDDAGWYSWKLIYPSPTDDPPWKDADPAITSTLSAREINGAKGLTGKRFLATFYGYDADDNPYYVFAAGGALPPGAGIYKVLMLIDDLDPGTPDWDYPRFSP